MVAYNEELFGSLPRLLGEKRKDIGEKIGMSRMWFTHTVNAGDVFIYHLVRLCNAYRIDIRAFLIREGDKTIPTPLVGDISTWENIDYHPELIKCLWQNRNDVVVKRKQLQEEMGIDKVTLSGFLDSEHSCMKIRDWVRMVNQYDLDPMMIFEDKNEWINNAALAEKDREIEILRQQLLKARLETSTLRSRMSHNEWKANS